MLYRFKQHIQSNFSFLRNAKLLVAVSGGLDSIVLTHLLYSLEYRISLAHVNFHLRGKDSDDDALFVKKIGERLKIPIFIKNAATESYVEQNKVSIQIAAREIRYQWFEYLLIKENYDYVLTAHHLNDSIETFFINLSRSAGLDGLLGIPQQNNKTVRPLLVFSRQDIVDYAQENQLDWREDSSNAETKYLRNTIRHQLIPIVGEIFPHFQESFANSIFHLSQSQSLVEEYIANVKTKIWNESEGLFYISLKELGLLPNQNAILYELLKDFGFTAWENVYDLVFAQSGTKIFSEKYILLKDRDFLVLSVKELEEKRNIKQVEGEFVIENSKFKISIINNTKTLGFKTESQNEVYFDSSRVNFPLFVRKWKKGDYFYPLGMQGKMKLSDFFINQKISLLDKEKIWLLCDAKDSIIWVIGKRVDNRFKITEKTNRICRITRND